MIGLIGLAAFVVGCLGCFLLGHRLGRSNDHTEARLIAARAEIEALNALNADLTKTLKLHNDLLTIAAPILEEHTWHDLGLNK